VLRLMLMLMMVLDGLGYGVECIGGWWEVLTWWANGRIFKRWYILI